MSEFDRGNPNAGGYSPAAPEVLIQDAGEGILTMPYGPEIDAAITGILAEHPSGRKLHLRDILWTTLQCRSLPESEFGYFFDTFTSDLRVAKVGKGYYKIRHSIPDEDLPSPVPGQETAARDTSASSFERMIKAWKQTVTDRRGLEK